MLSLGGFGLTLRALEARFGRLSLTGYHGLYEHSPMLAVCFLLDRPRQRRLSRHVGFIATGSAGGRRGRGQPLRRPRAWSLAAALNGIAVRAGLLFAIHRRPTSVRRCPCEIGRRERVAVLTLAALILGGGLYPQPGVSSRQQAAEEILEGSRYRARLTDQPVVREEPPDPIADRR